MLCVSWIRVYSQCVCFAASGCTYLRRRERSSRWGCNLCLPLVSSPLAEGSCFTLFALQQRWKIARRQSADSTWLVNTFQVQPSAKTLYITQNQLLALLFLIFSDITCCFPPKLCLQKSNSKPLNVIYLDAHFFTHFFLTCFFSPFFTVKRTKKPRTNCREPVFIQPSFSIGKVPVIKKSLTWIFHRSNCRFVKVSKQQTTQILLRYRFCSFLCLTAASVCERSRL